MRRSSLIFIWLMLISANIYGQHGKIETKLSPNGTIDKVVFYDSVTGNENVFNVLENNPYTNLGFKGLLNAKGLDKGYDLSGEDKKNLLSRFFASDKTASKNPNLVSFKSARVSSFVQASREHAVIIYNIDFRDQENIIGMKSTAIVLDTKGKVVSKLPEGNNGFFTPAITEDGGYIAFNEGDISSESAFVLFASPYFKVYHVHSGKEVFSIPNGDYSFMIPTSFKNLLIQILGKRNGIYEYYVISPELRFLYRKEYTSLDVGNLLRFQNDGMVFRESNGQERLDEFIKVFSISRF